MGTQEEGMLVAREGFSKKGIFELGLEGWGGPPQGDKASPGRGGVETRGWDVLTEKEMYVEESA